MKNTDIHTIYGTDPAFVNFFDNLAAEWGDESFSLSLGFAYNNMWIVGNSKITGMKSSFGALNDANFMNFQAATVFGFFSNNGAPWDLNGDGRLSFKESINWWRNGHGEPIRVPLSSVNLSRITPSHFNGIGSTRTLRLLLIGTVNDGLVHGRISLRLYPNNNVKAFDGYYDFDYKPWLTHPIRNVLTLFDQAIHGQGQRYEIDFTGSAPISSNPSISDYYMRGGLLW